MTPEEKRGIADAVMHTANDITEFLAERHVPVEIGMAALSMVLITTAKSRNLTRHQTVDRFIMSVNSVYKEGLGYGTDAGSKGKS